MYHRTPQSPSSHSPFDNIIQKINKMKQVVLLCLSNRLDFFPMPIWDSDNDPARPGSPSWVWAGGASLGQGGRGTGDVGRGEGFRVEEVGDDFFLLSYATPEGWRCAVEVHRFLVSNSISLFHCVPLFFCVSFAGVDRSCVSAPWYLTWKWNIRG